MRERLGLGVKPWSAPLPLCFPDAQIKEDNSTIIQHWPRTTQAPGGDRGPVLGVSSKALFEEGEAMYRRSYTYTIDHVDTSV